MDFSGKNPIRTLKKPLKLLKQLKFREFRDQFFIDFVKRKSEINIYERLFSPPGKSVAGDCEVYLSVCAIIKNEGPYLKEWIEFHRLVGVERFYLYDNESDDETSEVLGPYIDKGIVQLTPWPRFIGYSDPQHMAYAHCMRATFGKTFWLALIDADEFLFAPKGGALSQKGIGALSQKGIGALSQVLRGFEENSAVGVTSYTFDHCGHSQKPAGLVIENYLTRYPVKEKENFKSIVQPGTVCKVSNAHWFHLEPAARINGRAYKTSSGRSRRAICVSTELLRIHHYYTKSTEEYAIKLARGSTRAFDPNQVKRMMRKIRDRKMPVEDTSILQLLPELKRVMSKQLA